MKIAWFNKNSSFQNAKLQASSPRIYNHDNNSKSYSTTITGATTMTDAQNVSLKPKPKQKQQKQLKKSPKEQWKEQEHDEVYQTTQNMQPRGEISRLASGTTHADEEARLRHKNMQERQWSKEARRRRRRYIFNANRLQPRSESKKKIFPIFAQDHGI